MKTSTNEPAIKSTPSTAGDLILLLADLQDDFIDVPLTIPFARLKRNVAALMKLAAIFDIPLVVTCVPIVDGEEPMLVQEINDARQDAPVIVRTTSNSLDDARVRAAIKASGRKTLLVAGIATEVAVQSASLTAVFEGFDVHILVDTCAGLSERTEAAAHARLIQAGVKMSSLPALIGEVAGDSTQPKGRAANEVLLGIVTT